MIRAPQYAWIPTVGSLQPLKTICPVVASDFAIQANEKSSENGALPYGEDTNSAIKTIAATRTAGAKRLFVLPSRSWPVFHIRTKRGFGEFSKQRSSLASAGDDHAPNSETCYTQSASPEQISRM